jgi:hypothetical protein
MPQRLYRVSEVDGVEQAHIKCDHCRYRVNYLYLLAESEAEVRDMVNGEGPTKMEFNGFCGSCMCDMIATNVADPGGGDVSGYELQEEQLES